MDDNKIDDSSTVENETQNAALPDQGQSDGNDEGLADQVPGPQG